MTYLVISMPIDSLGRGPCAEADCVRVIWEVWDECWATVAEFDTKEEADVWVSRMAERQKLRDEMESEVNRVRKYISTGVWDARSTN